MARLEALGNPGDQAQKSLPALTPGLEDLPVRGRARPAGDIGDQRDAERVEPSAVAV